MEITAFIISSLALLFTLYSFWWMNWRLGNLVVSAPRTYAAGTGDNKLLIEIPLVLYNSGPKPIIVENLQLRFQDEQFKIPPLFFNATVDKLGTDENRAFATQFAVPGNKTLSLICEFQARTDFKFGEAEYLLSLEARINEKDWVLVKEFEIKVSLASAVILSEGKLHVADNHA